jgi:hypothetical protein
MDALCRESARDGGGGWGREGGRGERERNMKGEGEKKEVA